MKIGSLSYLSLTAGFVVPYQLTFRAYSKINLNWGKVKVSKLLNADSSSSEKTFRNVLSE